MTTYDSDLAMAQRLQAEEFANSNMSPEAQWNTYQLSSTAAPVAYPYNLPNHTSSSSRRNSQQHIYDDADISNQRASGALPYMFTSINRMRSRTAPNVVQQNVATDINDFTERSTKLLIIYISIGLIELITASVVLTVSYSQSCDKPLAQITALYCARWLILIPLALHQYSANRRSAALHQVKQWTDLASVLLWSMMQLWLYSSQTCSDEVPMLYKFDIALVAIEYVRILLPLVLTIMLVCSLPFVLLIMRLLTPSRGAKTHALEQLETRVYTQNDVAKAAADSSIDTECSICSEQYVPYDKLTVLPCEHYYHTPCIQQWLKINAVCALCRHAINQPKPAAAHDAETAAEIAV